MKRVIFNSLATHGSRNPRSLQRIAATKAPWSLSVIPQTLLDDPGAFSNQHKKVNLWPIQTTH